MLFASSFYLYFEKNTMLIYQLKVIIKKWFRMAIYFLDNYKNIIEVKDYLKDIKPRNTGFKAGYTDEPTCKYYFLNIENISIKWINRL